MKVAVGSRMGLRSRLMLLALATLIPMFALQLAASLSQRDELTVAARAQVREIASQMAAQSAELVSDGNTLVRMLARMPTLVTIDDASCQTMLASIMRDTHSVTSASIVQANGEVSCTSFPSIGQIPNLADRGWFKQARSMTSLASGVSVPVLSDLVVSRLTGNPTIVVAGRIPLRPEMVAISMDLTRFSERATKLSASDEVLLLVDPRSGVVLARSPPKADMAGQQPDDQQPIDATLLAALRSSRHGTVDTAGVDGVPRIFGYATLTGLSGGYYTVAVGRPRALVGADAGRRFRRSLLWQLLAGAGAIAAALTLARSALLRPLQLLSDAADRLGQGDLRARVSLEQLTMPEFRAVAIALNSAAGQIESRDRSLAELADMDHLTRVANRRQFDAVLDREWRRAVRARAPLALMLVDVDFFKAYNDIYGHVAGDDALIAVAQAINRTLRRPGDLAARYGGEEFGAILPDIDEAGLRLMAERLCEAVQSLAIVHSGSDSGVLTVSVGASLVVPDEGLDAARALIATADQALYVAKRNGRNCTDFKMLASAALVTTVVAQLDHITQGPSKLKNPTQP